MGNLYVYDPECGRMKLIKKGVQKESYYPSSGKIFSESDEKVLEKRCSCGIVTTIFRYDAQGECVSVSQNMEVAV